MVNKRLIYLAFALIFNCVPLSPENGVDFRFASGVFPSSLTAGMSASFSYELENAGNANSLSGPVVEIYLSPHFYFDNYASMLFTDNIPESLNAGEKVNRTVTVNIPVNAVTPCYIMLKIVSNDTEIDTGNIVSTSQLITVSGGTPFRNQIVSDNLYHDYTINSSTTHYLYFTGLPMHAYQIYWDDFSEGLVYAGSGADIKVSAKTSTVPITSFFSSMDNGFLLPGTTYTAIAQDILLDITSGSWGGGYALKIVDIGTPPDLSISNLSSSYNTGQKNVTIDYTIQNTGPGDTTSNCFNVGFLWYNVTPVPGGSRDSVDQICQVIPALTGLISNRSIVIPLATDPGIVRAFIDIDMNVAESDENNNTW